MNLDTFLPLLLVAQGVMGGFDTLFNHEWRERLPYRPEARNEIGLHSIREAIYGTLFLGLAWFSWHGFMAGLIAALLVAETVVTSFDELVENHTRVLPQNERLLHVFLTLNFGLLIAVLLPALYAWSQLPSGLVLHHFGVWSWVLSAFGAAGIAWSLRDLLAWRRLSRQRT